MAKSTKQDNKQTYTPGIADEICRRISAGESLIGICEDVHMPDTDTVMQWFVGDLDGFQRRYMEAGVNGIYVKLMEDPTIKAFLDFASQPLSLPSRVPSRALAAQVCENLGYQNYDETLDQLVTSGLLAA